MRPTEEHRLIEKAYGCLPGYSARLFFTKSKTTGPREPRRRWILEVTLGENILARKSFKWRKQAIDWKNNFYPRAALLSDPARWT